MPDDFHLAELTPPGRGAVATLRLEGPGAMGAVAGRFRTRRGQPLDAAPADRLLFGCFLGEAGEEEVVLRTHADGAVDLHCHGGRAAVAMIAETLRSQGGRMQPWQSWAAEYHSDPVKSAAMVALAEARTRRTAAILLDQYHGALTRAFTAIDQALAEARRPSAAEQINRLLARAELGGHLCRPWRVVLAGRPNVGKSSLINALLGYRRAIVHHQPGTTRDVVAAEAAVDGWPIELADTAGWRLDGGPLEQSGIALAEQQAATADLVVVVFDASEAWSPSDEAMFRRWPEALVVHNKCDLPAASGYAHEETGRALGVPEERVSALTGEGIARLIESIAARLVPNAPPPGAAVPFAAEHVAWLSTRL